MNDVTPHAQMDALEDVLQVVGAVQLLVANVLLLVLQLVEMDAEAVEAAQASVLLLVKEDVSYVLTVQAVTVAQVVKVVVVAEEVVLLVAQVAMVVEEVVTMDVLAATAVQAVVTLALVAVLLDAVDVQDVQDNVQEDALEDVLVLVQDNAQDAQGLVRVVALAVLVLAQMHVRVQIQYKKKVIEW